MPTIQDLNSLMFTDPGMFQQGQQIIDQGMLANQLANQQAQANIDRTTLANQFAAQNNPQLLQHQDLLNSELGMRNDLTQSTMDESKQARRAAFMKQLSEDDLSAFTAKAKLDMMSDDPDVAARAKRQIDASKDEIDRREKLAAEEQKARIAANSRTEVATTNAGARMGAAGIMANAQMYRADTIAKAKALAAEKDPSTLEGMYTKAIQEFRKNPTPDNKAYMEAARDEFMNKAIAGQANNPDVGQLGNIPTQGKPAMPTFQPRAPQGAMAPNNVPPVSQDVFNQDTGSAPSTPARDQSVASQDIVALQNELSKPNLSAETKRVLQEQLAATQKLLGTGRVVIYKDGKGYSIPEANVQKALSQGYTRTK